MASDKPGVLIVGRFLSGEGRAPGVCEELADILADRGWRVTTTSSKLGGLASLLDMLHTVVSERRTYAIAQMDVFSGPAFSWAEVISALLKFLGKPCILTLHGGGLPAFSRRWPGRVNRVLRSAAVVTTPSAYLFEAFREKTATMTLLPNGIHAQRYRGRHRTRVTPRLLWVRSFHSIYNPVMAIEVLSLLLEAHPDARLTMIGPDKHDGSLQETMNAVQRLGVGEQVQIVGFVPKCDLPDWFDAADVFLNTARVDNAPVTVIEAMVSGMCVVSTDVGGVSSLVQHRSNGLLVPSGKAFEMMQAVHELVGDADLAARCSGAAMHARKQRDWESLVLDWESLLLSVYRGSERSMGL